MELKEFFQNILKNKALLAAFIALGLIIGTIYILMPPKYYATGSFLITRRVSPEEQEFFTYEGYYGQQTALSFTKTVTALIESEDVLSKSLSNMNLSVNQNSLRNLSKKVKVTNPGPQLITLQIKEESQENALKTWEAVSNSTIKTAQQTNMQGDPLLGISKISEQPVIKMQYKPLIPIISAAALSGVCLYLIIISLKEYSK